VSVATCLRCGFRAGARKLALLQRTVQDHDCVAPMYGGEERRQHRRWRVAFGARCYSKLGSGRCAITDISRVGMGVRSSQSHTTGDEVTAAFRLPPDPQAFHVTGVVRRVSKNTVGIEFSDISASDQHRILQFVSQQQDLR
jgi:PilZ domain